MGFFEDIQSDNTSGSGTILDKVQNRLLSYEDSREDVEAYLLIDSLNSLLDTFPQFGLLIHFTKFLSTELNKTTTITGKDLANLVKRYAAEWDGSQTAASTQFLNHLDLGGKSILLHSNSSAIHKLFSFASTIPEKPVIWQTYSSPKGEGKLQARQLLNMGYAVHLFHEDNLNKFIKQIDLAIFGADLILENRFLNKSGTYAIALQLREAGLPVFVLAEERKKMQEAAIPHGILAGIENERNKPESDFGPDLDQNLVVHNHYFEFTPLALVDKLFLD